MSDPGRKSESLIRRLRLSPTELEDFDPIPAFLLRKYIMYARQYVCPKMSSDAKEVLMDFYIQLRKSHCSVDGTPITTRQLESMIRLAEARAKVELREEVTGADARDVVEIMKESLADLFTDDRGCVDFTRSSGMSQGKQALLYMRQLTILSREKEDAIFSEKELLEIAKRMNLNVSHFGQFVDKLNQQGFLLKKGNKLYQVSTSEFSQ